MDTRDTRSKATELWRNEFIKDGSGGKLPIHSISAFASTRISFSSGGHFNVVQDRIQVWTVPFTGGRPWPMGTILKYGKKGSEKGIVKKGLVYSQWSALFVTVWRFF